MVPDGWKKRSLGDLFDFKNGLNADKNQYGDGYKFVNVMDVLGNSVITEKNIIGRVRVTEKQLQENRLEFGDVLFNRTSETFSEIAMASVYMDRAIALFGGFVIRGRIKSKSLLPAYAIYTFQSEGYRNQAVKLGQGAVRANIGQKDLSKVSILVPPISEQHKISKILSTWDKAISANEQLIIKTQRQKYALQQQLLSEQVRLPGFHGQWKILPLANCLIGSSQRNVGLAMGADAIRSVSKIEGMIPMREATIGKSIERYKIVKPGWFAYNPMRINVGSICRWPGPGDCLVSPDYVVFSCNENMLLAEYLDYFRQSARWGDYMERAGNGSVRVRIYLEDLNQLEIPLPSVVEQKEIVSVLRTADCEIDALKRSLHCLRQEKKALMQQLLTGKLRVKLDEMEVA
ncbi:TPA: restriction endonuclease subunit S [Pseudomonas aeruginosa]|uniref:restriction endonuclease subunit S n=1 Tax=Pseudomonas aeruginosa TaxID=287 RepID=UPI000F7A4732|nr:restriction endonuclease subunit S [Pseudomonas aeruginosa]MBR7823019.1 restriction endonuclease subunit S [Pseudomonas aeruginosa]MBR7851227.1 restriction endonuclease subunit S [Pseudomonas aeruginosa]MBR7863889.1 restriction endonuclease subunit S [Pseudomonas aeruginosa]MBR7870692.1 restriction endonuclease subunit S [Pseudomonas aeruginosa]MBW6202538.1 restriction endonuclease subunit S [Pseudomonas aeruginosa]